MTLDLMLNIKRLYHNLYNLLLDVMLTMCIALRNCKDCDSILRVVDNVLTVVVLIAPEVDHHPKHRRPCHGSVAARVTATSHRPSPIT